MEHSSEILLNDQETIQYYNPQVTLLTLQSSSQLTNLGSGELFITTQRVHWKNSQIEVMKTYPQFGLHAISKDLNNFPAPCLYCQLYSEELEEGEEPTQLVYIPSDSSQCNSYTVQTMFDVFTECSAMNPSPEFDAGLEGEMGDEYVEDMEMEGDSEPMDTDN